MLVTRTCSPHTCPHILGPHTLTTQAPQDIHIEDLDAASTGPLEQAAPPGGWAVSPTELREALGSLDHGRLVQHFAVGDMHDAAEVLGAVYQCLHSAELGEQAPDPTLPTRLPGGGVAGRAPQGPLSTVQRLFGMEVQVPAVEEDGDADGAWLNWEKKARVEKV